MVVSRLFKNTIWNFFGSVLPMVVGLSVIPYYIRSLGVEKFGVLTLIWALIGYFSIFDFGIGRALTLVVSKRHDSNTQTSWQEEVNIGLQIMFFAGILGFVVLFVLSNVLASSWLNVGDNYIIDTNQALVVSSFVIPLITYTSGLRGILEGLEDFVVLNYIKIFQGVASFVLPILFILIFDSSLLVVTIALLLTRIIAVLWYFVRLQKLIGVWNFLSFKGIRLGQAKGLINNGMWFTISNLVGPLMVYADRFLISSVLGAAVVAFYTVPFDLAIRLLVIPSSFTTTLFPKFSAFHKEDRGQLKELFNRSMMWATVLMGSILLVGVAFAEIGLKLWLGSSFSSESAIVLKIVLVGVCFNGIAQLPHALVQAIGKVKITGLLNLAEFIFYLPLLFLLIPYLGLVGAALAFTIRALVDCVFLLVFAKNSITHSQKDALKFVVKG